jgi:hypothetical protein
MATLAVALALFPNYSWAQALDTNCRRLTSSYGSSGTLYEFIRDANTSNIAPADFYDTVACECRVNLKQTVREAIAKAIAATNAGLWAAEPMHHDLTSQENREADAFANWIKGRGSRPTMHGVLACAYSTRIRCGSTWLESEVSCQFRLRPLSLWRTLLSQDIPTPRRLAYTP